MKAWQYVSTGSPISLNEVPEPQPGPGEVAIQVHAAGLCHSDVGALDDPGWKALLTEVPRTLGHEIAGRVKSLGEGVTELAVGDRVAMLPISPWRPGFSRDGGFAAVTTAPVESLVRVPDAVPFVQAAAATDSGLTAHRAVTGPGGVGPGVKIGIIGIGGLGQIGARVSVLRGAEVYAAEVKEAVWPMARELGVTAVSSSILDFQDAQLDVIVDFAGYGVTTADALKTVRPGGRVVLVGMGRLSVEFDTVGFITGKRQLIGSGGGDHTDVEAVLDYMASGQLTPQLTKIGFDDIGDGIDRLRRGDVVGRLVAAYTDESLHPATT